MRRYLRSSSPSPRSPSRCSPPALPAARTGCRAGCFRLRRRGNAARLRGAPAARVGDGSRRLRRRRGAPPGPLPRSQTGDRADDAVGWPAAMTAQADRPAVNLAARVADGDEIYVPRSGRSARTPGRAAERGSRRSRAAMRPRRSPGSVDVNAAGAATLGAVPGIGPRDRRAHRRAARARRARSRRSTSCSTSPA